MHWHDRVLTNKRMYPHRSVGFRSGRILTQYTRARNASDDVAGTIHQALLRTVSSLQPAAAAAGAGAARQGLTLVHVRGQLEKLQDTFMS